MQLADNALDQIFRNAHSVNGFVDRPVPDELLRNVYDLMKWGPTASNGCPCRIVFVRTTAGKQALAPALDKGNQDKTMSAPATAIVAYDVRFYAQFPKLAPQLDASKWVDRKPEDIRTYCLRNGSLQGAYLMIAARALGLDCGPMSGFENAAVDAAFFPDGQWKSNFLCNLGYGDPASIRPRKARLDFNEACRLL
ncbi:MAG: malonic semialdehyde reductase [Casimicrobiaceae bacterium]